MTKVKHRMIEKSHGLPRAVSNHHGQRRPQHLQVPPRLRPGGHRRVPPRQCREEAPGAMCWSTSTQRCIWGLRLPLRNPGRLQSLLRQTHLRVHLEAGIDDGFLAPYKVVRVDLTATYKAGDPEGMVDDLGQEIEDRVYNQRDMDKVLVLNEQPSWWPKRLWTTCWASTLRKDHRVLRKHRPCRAHAQHGQRAARVPGEATGRSIRHPHHRRLL